MLLFWAFVIPALLVGFIIPLPPLLLTFLHALNFFLGIVFIVLSLVLGKKSFRWAMVLISSLQLYLQADILRAIGSNGTAGDMIEALGSIFHFGSFESHQSGSLSLIVFYIAYVVLFIKFFSKKQYPGSDELKIHRATFIFHLVFFLFLLPLLTIIYYLILHGFDFNAVLTRVSVLMTGFGMAVFPLEVFRSAGVKLFLNRSTVHAKPVIPLAQKGSSPPRA